MKTKCFYSLVVLTLLLGLFAGPGTAAPMTKATLATITVTTTTDELNNDGDCSLREAIKAANTDSAVDACTAGSGADTIILPAGTYILTIPGKNENANATGDLDILQDVTISGGGMDVTVLDANGIDRALQVLAGVSAAVNGLTVTGGNANDYGGGIYNQGTLNLSDCRITDNAAALLGGGVMNDLGILTITACEISLNTAVNGGGGINNYGGQATIRQSTISENAATKAGYGSGGGLLNSAEENHATLTLTDSTVISNTATNSGGGVGNDFTAGWSATLTIDDVTIHGNSAVVGGNYLKGLGGGVANTVIVGAASGAGIVNIRYSDIGHNKGTNGGGIGSSPATATGSVTMQVKVESSTIGDNTAGGNGSQVGNGGGILSMDGALTLINSTLSGNHATGTGSALSGLGGGLLAGSMSLPGAANVVATTISENTAVLGGNGVANANLGGGATLRFKSSLVSANGALSCLNSSGVVTSLGYNLEDHNSCGFNQASDQINSTPLLGPLADNGGYTWTYALLAGSPAIDKGSCTDHNSATISFDQRGVLRPQGAACDSGAYEVKVMFFEVYLPVVVRTP